jgi:Glycoside hydrolase family 44
MGVLLLVLVAAPFILLNRVPKSYPPAANPIEPPGPGDSLGGGLDGFSSPYLGHTGSWDGQGGAMGGRPKTDALDAEAAMGLRWTFMPVYWRALEPDGPVDLTKETPPAWRALDAFIIAAHQRKLNVLMQAPVIGGNAGGPPAWAGRREKGKSAPANMEAAAAFAGKLAARYAPGGALATREGWQQRYGVRAWELDNEPDGYLTHWKGQAADYAEFVTKAAAALRQIDPQAVIVGPSVMGGGKSIAWIEAALDAPATRGSPEFRKRGQPYSIGSALDVVSFHIYEGLNAALPGRDRTIEVVFSDIRRVFEDWENRAPGFAYPRKRDYWHTEGNFDFLGILSRERRAAWRIQFLTRAFAAGIRKVIVMDASRPEQTAVRAYIRALPDPFPMERADARIMALAGRPVVFCHQDHTNADAGRVWILWAGAGTGDAEVELPCVREQIRAVRVDGTESVLTVTNRQLRIHLSGDSKMAPPVLVIDQVAPSQPFKGLNDNAASNSPAR